jgi:hypothetical protein
MNLYQKVNNGLGWLMFALASTVYILTAEPTTSFWDCGEYISTAYKLQVGHPPGAPFFQLIGRFFTLFTTDTSQVAFAINVMSALMSSLTILFLFWTITHFALKMVTRNNTKLTTGNMIAVFGSGLVGALAYTFSDTFWFSAVEGEVYAMSSFFTALVFWCMIKWERVADDSRAWRWIILIAYLMGLSIGVHLLNLLTIPAITLIYYFRRYKTHTPKGIIISLMASVVLLAIIMNGIIPMLVSMAGITERFFVNSLRLPFDFGTVFYFLTLTALIVWGLIYTSRKKKVVLNVVILSFTFLVIGYSTFLILVVRSNANPPIDENNPEDAVSLLAYLNREQYGTWPIFYGPYYNAPLNTTKPYKDGNPVYTRDDEQKRYVITDSRKATVPNYDERFMTFFPRMWSNSQRHHASEYQRWADIKGVPITVPKQGGGTEVLNKPTFGENLTFMFRYQIGHMYLRYFMWNFAGRQNDIQGSGGPLHGNWISGIKFIDEWRLGPQEDLPYDLARNKARNKYYMLPLLLGMIGFFFQLNKDYRDSIIVTLLFLLTGLAIVLYLNQYSPQPRERDYAFAASFYAFAIWIGLGVLAIAEFISKKLDMRLAAAATTLVCFFTVPFIMAKENWDDHDRSGRYTALAVAKNYLNSCAPNAILFTNGDNDTFPLWYAQEVEGIRTDVRVVNLSLLNTDWYIDQMVRKAYNSEPVPFSLTKKQYIQGTRDYVYIVNQSDFLKPLLDKIAEVNLRDGNEDFEHMKSLVIETLTKSNFKDQNAADFAQISNPDNKLSFSTWIKFVNFITTDNNVLRYGFNTASIHDLKNLANSLTNSLLQSHIPLRILMDFVASDDPKTKYQTGRGFEAYFPTSKFSIPVDKAKVLANGTVPERYADSILTSVDWTLDKYGVMKNHLMVLDLLASFDWERPIYFAITTGDDAYINLMSFFFCEGLAYKLMPVQAISHDGQTGAISTNEMYDNLMNKFEWGNMGDPNVYLDETNMRLTLNFRNIFGRLANALVLEGKKDSAIAVCDRAMEVMPDEAVPFNYFIMPIMEAYYAAGATDKGNVLAERLVDIYSHNLKYFFSFTGELSTKVNREKEEALGVLHRINQLTERYGQTEVNKKGKEVFDLYYGIYAGNQQQQQPQQLQ